MQKPKMCLLSLLLVITLQACANNATQLTNMQSEGTLYTRMGGLPVITKIVDEYLNKVINKNIG